MVEAEIHLIMLPKFKLDIYNVFEPLVCCLKGIWVHPYTVTDTPAKLAPDMPSVMVEAEIHLVLLPNPL